MDTIKIINTVNKKQKPKIFMPIMLVILILYTLIVFGVLLLTFMTSIKTNKDFTLNMFGWPTKFAFDNYIKAFEAVKVAINTSQGMRYVYLWEQLWNSLLYSIGCAAISVFVQCIVAYLVAKFNFKFSKFIYFCVILAMMLPIVGSLPAEINMMNMLNLNNTLIGVYIKSASFLGVYFLVFYASFKTLSWEYAEAAEIDGAGHFTIMFKIMIPLVRSTILAVFILTFMSYWNDYQTPMIYLKDIPTAAVGLFNACVASSTLFPIQMSACLLLFLPILVVFMCFKNIFMGNLTLGGLKG